MHTFPDIDRLKALLDQKRPLDPAIVRNLREDLMVRWTYHSNAIEGNTLTLEETRVALEGITIGGSASWHPHSTIDQRIMSTVGFAFAVALTTRRGARRLAGSKQRTVQKSLAVNWRCASQGSTDPPRLGPSGYAHQGGCFTYGRCCP